ncbi:MAG TPA: hypothetical protein VF290_16500 [Pyrinomonadaceae bacterium]
MSQAILPWLGVRRLVRTIRAQFDEKFRHWTEQFVNVLASEGMTLLGPTTASHVVCQSHEFDFNPEMESSEFSGWEEIHEGGRRIFEAQTGMLDSPFPLIPFLEAIELGKKNEGVLFAAEIRTGRVESPNSMIARIWDECLGARAIPFDSAEREALIADGKKHPELKRHIEAWEEMKRTGSKWVTGKKVR